MENTKTYEQEVMWCFTANSEIRAAEHILNYRDESILVVVACNAKDCMSVTIVNLRPPLASLENEEPPLK